MANAIRPNGKISCSRFDVNFFFVFFVPSAIRGLEAATFSLSFKLKLGFLQLLLWLHTRPL